MNTLITARLDSLRSLMRREGIGAFIIPSADPHGSEYLPPRWQSRAWLSGFTGSAGTLVVTADDAALWTDSRYWLEAGATLQGTGIRLMRLRHPDTPSLEQWTAGRLAAEGSTVCAVDGLLVTQAEAAALTESLRRLGGITLRTNLDPMDHIWPDRPAAPLNAIRIHPDTFAGETAQSKIERIRRAVWDDSRAHGILISQLDDIAWTLNLRGTDIDYTPVFVAYLLLGGERTGNILFTDPRKLTPEVRACLDKIGVATAPYTDIDKALARYDDYNILLPADATSARLYAAVRRAVVVSRPSPVPLMKIVKNEAERQGYRRAMEADGVAMIRAWRWLEARLAAGAEPTECEFAERLRTEREPMEGFTDLSFETIVGYGPNAAIVHYEPKPDTCAKIKPRGLVLTDSGAQYRDATTDISRTIATGPVTAEEREAYTLVMRGHLRLMSAIFPDGAAGTQIDYAAREAMWRAGVNYGHGTGHGVGSCLCVHEGPHQIRQEWHPTPLREGMTVTDEPGIYAAGRYGVRTENTLLIVPASETEFGRFLKFEPLTLCPYDLTPLNIGELSPIERQTLEAYHETVRSRLSPLLNSEEREWLESKLTIRN